MKITKNILLSATSAIMCINQATAAPIFNKNIQNETQPSTLSSPPKESNNMLPTLVIQPDPVLPLWGREARKQGYDLPEPFGLSFNYMSIHQNIDVDKISFSGLALGPAILPSTLFDIAVGKTQQYSATKTLRLDAWILPFMNVYGILGKTRGGSRSTVSVDSDPSKQRDPLTKGIAEIIHGMKERGDLKDLDFRLNFHGTTWGAGTILAGGYKHWFGLIDMNYTSTQFDILDGSINAFTLSPRVGYRFSLAGAGTFFSDESQLSIWGGSMYQNVQQEFKGHLSDLRMPAKLQELMKIADQQGKGYFDVRQHLESPWNILLGTNLAFNRNFGITLEAGFEKRNSFLVSGEYRF